MLALQGIPGDMIVLSWMFERAARWTLDRHGVRGQIGQTLLVDPSQEDEEDEHAEDEGDSESSESPDQAGKTRVADERFAPSRRIYCLDLRVASSAAPFVEEIRRIAAECRMQLVSLGDWISGSPPAYQLARFQQPTNDTALPMGPVRPTAAPGPFVRDTEQSVPDSHPPLRIQEEPDRRWYPVIDFSRCTNCMECIDFCLFGVYGVDQSETIVVEQPDNCRKGCPACSRVCPENAIMFPQHKTPGIAGAPLGLVSLKIDLSKLFGAPEEGKSAAELAALERDEQLIIAGRQPVGMATMPKRQVARQEKSSAPKDEFDSLLDELDQANL
jgi:NAD-dependent dihydropyrimidine dehydrogenase PreA subunit